MGLEKFIIFCVSGLQENKSRSFCYANGRYISSQSTFSFSSISFQKADADPEFQERGDPLQFFFCGFAFKIIVRFLQFFYKPRINVYNII